MRTVIIDGKLVAEEISSSLKKLLRDIEKPPILSVVSVGQNDVGQSFVNTKKRFGGNIGVEVVVHSFDKNIDPEVLRLSILSIVRESDGVIVQLPLPVGFNERAILNLVPPEKDPDMLNIFSRELFAKCKSKTIPPVAGAVGEIFKRNNINPRRGLVTVIGTGALVGAPIVSWLNCQGVLPRVVDKRNSPEEITEAVNSADIVISGTGVSGLITPDMIKERSVLIDAGTSSAEGQIRGDMDPLCREKASVFTPVPGGIGPITIAKLFENLLILTLK